MPRKPLPLPDAELLHSELSITPDWRLMNKVSRTSRRAGEIADIHGRKGYRTVYVAGKLRFAHRVIWKMTFGEDPVGYLDHIDGDILNNDPANLRETTHSQNMMNRKIHKNSSSGIKCVHHRKDNGMWRAYISVDGERKRLGQYHTKEEAEVVVMKAREELHGQYARAA